VAAIGAAELPHGGWTDLISILVNSVTNSVSTEMLKEATLEAIGYLCQDIVRTDFFASLLLIAIRIDQDRLGSGLFGILRF
jgi:hypothetical protein